MPSGSPVALFVALLACVGVVAFAGVGVADAGPAPQVADDGSGANTTMVVELQADGDARWTVSTTFNLTGENETDQYREVASAFERGESAELGLPAFRRASSLADEASNRSMEITEEARESAPERVVENGTGRLSLSFTWTNFARVQSDRLHVGDVFQTEEGQWLPGLDADQSLVVHPPDGYYPSDANVAPENRTLRWEGPTAFSLETLNATFAGSPTGQPTATATATPDGNDDSTLLGAGLILLGVAALALVGYLAVRRDEIDLPEWRDGDGPAASGATGPDDGDESETVEATDDPDDVDEELLSDEERVEHLLEENGGRMKQAHIVKETGWSNAKVSQLLSSMQEDGRIDKLRIGRENLISFPDEDITDAQE